MTLIDRLGQCQTGSLQKAKKRMTISYETSAVAVTNNSVTSADSAASADSAK
jgi:hypothetical protein